METIKPIDVLHYSQCSLMTTDCRKAKIVKPRLHNTTGCQTRCQTGLTTGCIVYTYIQPVVNAV